MRFECTHCGKKYSSADEPTPGRVYVIGCKCGHSIVVKGPEKPHPAAAARPPVPPPAAPLAPRVQVAPPVAAQAQGRRPAAIVPPAPSPEPLPAEPAPFPEAGARRGRAGPSLDPFADMPEFSGQAGARPLADVPEIKGPIPEPTPTPRSFDPFAAQQGLLLEEDVARAIQEPAGVPAHLGPDSEEVAVTFSEQLPVASPPRIPAARPRLPERALRPARTGGRSIGLAAWIAVGAALLAVVAGASWYLFARRSPTRPPAVAPAAPLAAPVPAPPPAAPHATAPIPVPAPAPAPPPVAVAVPPPRAEPPPVPAPAPPPPARSAPEREPPRRAAPARAQKRAPAPAPEPVVAAAPAVAAPTVREPTPPPPPAPAEPPRREPAAKPKTAAAAPDKAMLDLLRAKQDAPAAPPPAAAAKRGDGDGLSPADVEAAVKKNRKAFDTCVEDAVRNEPALQVLGRRVGLYLTVNPSGIVTAPRLDDPELLDTELGACLKSTARKMVFPQFAGDPFQVKVPLVLGRE